MSQFTDVGVRPDDRTWIVVLGGGVGGVAAARHLDRALAAPDVELTLVSRDNFFLLTPLLFEACSGVLELRHCAQPIRPCLRRGRFVRGDRRGVVWWKDGSVEADTIRDRWCTGRSA